MLSGRLHVQPPIESADAPPEDVEVSIAEDQLPKLDGFEAGTPVLLDAVIVAAPPDGVILASYPVFSLAGIRYGLTAVTRPPPVRDTTIVRVRVGQQISLRIVR